MIRFSRYARMGQALIFLALSSVGFANPKGESVVAGQAGFTRAGSSLKITTSDRAIINWQDFSIQNGETTQFSQPSSSSVTLNRVVSGNPSAIFGDLRANGQIYLINPNGILIGESGRIDTGGFLASTLDVSNQEFLSGKEIHFFGPSKAAISNHGSITTSAGDVILVGRQIQNSGSISAKNG